VKPFTLLRLAAVLAALQFTAHTTMFLRYTPKHGPAEVALVEAMQSQRFHFGGTERSYWDFYFGYGLMSAFSVFLEILLFWQLATLARATPARVRPLVALFIFANLVHAALCAKYFFVTPIIPDLVIAGCLGLAFITAREKVPPAVLSPPPGFVRP
jgi:hypothetical protein